ncbi:MAG: nuclear transport factor 2 family protein [Solirubrobacteraceae bacterium]
MSQQNMDVVRTFIEATNRGDFAAAMAAYADDVLLIVEENAVPTGAGSFTGREAVGAWFADWFRSFARGYRFEIEEIDALGDRVFMVASHHGRGRSSGVSLDWFVAYAIGVEKGKIARLELYATRSDARDAVGLTE